MASENKKEHPQMVACQWLEDNYINHGHLRHDIVTDRLQVRVRSGALERLRLEDAALENEEQLLPILFDVPAEGRGVFMTTAQISEHIVSFGNIKKPMSVSQLGMLLGRAGYTAVTRRVGGIKSRGWIVYQRDSEEINSLKRLLKD